MRKREQNRTTRSASETMLIHYFCHIGFSASRVIEFFEEVKGRSISRKQYDSATETMRPIYKRLWPRKMPDVSPGVSITSRSVQFEYSLLAASMYSLYDKKVYEGLTLEELVEAYSLYTNLRLVSGSKEEQISPTQAHHVVKALKSWSALIPYCNKCDIRYFSVENQTIKPGCPCCETVAKDDYNILLSDMIERA